MLTKVRLQKGDRLENVEGVTAGLGAKTPLCPFALCNFKKL